MAFSRFDKIRIVLIIVSLVVVATAAVIQLTGQSKVSDLCSYLDPISIDILAFIAGIFLIVEGFYSIYNNKNLGLKRQLHRIIRIALGFAILTLHLIQFMHK